MVTLLIFITSMYYLVTISYSHLHYSPVWCATSKALMINAYQWPLELDTTKFLAKTKLAGQAIDEPMYFQLLQPCLWWRLSKIQCYINNIGSCYFAAVPSWTKSYWVTGHLPNHLLAIGAYQKPWYRPSQELKYPLVPHVPLTRTLIIIITSIQALESCNLGLHDHTLYTWPQLCMIISLCHITQCECYHVE